MRCRVVLACLCASAFSLVGPTVDSAEAAERVTHTVVIDGLKYIPETLTVKRGDSVVWINKDPFPHTVTAAGVFDSHSIAADKSWTYIAGKSGYYRYICTLHPNMAGTLKVE